MKDYILDNGLKLVYKKGNSELLNIINKVLNRLKEEGKIEEFVIKHTS